MLTDLLEKVIVKVSNWFFCSLSVSNSHNFSLLWSKKHKTVLKTFRLELMLLDFKQWENAKEHK